MSRTPFTGEFMQQAAIPEDAITAALAVIRSGRLHRYNLGPDEVGEAAALERDFARWQGARFCLAVASGGQAMQIALRASGVGPGAKVLTNAFTLAPVPGAIAAVGAEAVLVEITEDLVIDLDDLEATARASGARTLLVSHMRGHMCDMDRLGRIARGLGMTVIEDCAHTMGAKWNGRRAGSFGLAGCFSTQTYKHLNSGEGGLLASDDAEFMARATILSGSYMNYGRHVAGPGAEQFAEVRLDMPNMSARMDNLRAALLRPQLRDLDASIADWNARYDLLTGRLAQCPAIRLPRRPSAEAYVGSSIQFLVPGIDGIGAQTLVAALARSGVEVKWFGSPDPVGFTSAHRSWRYLGRQHLPGTDAVLARLFDMRLPLSFSLGDCDLIAAHIVADVTAVMEGAPA